MLGGSSGFSIDVGDLAVLGDVTDAIPAGFLHRNLFDEEGGIGAVGALALDDVREVGLEDVVAEDQHEVVVDVVLHSQQGVGQSGLLALVGVGDWHALELVAVVADDDLLFVADDHEEFAGVEFDEAFETVGEDGLSVDLDHPLRLVVGERSEPGPLPGGQHNGLHAFVCAPTSQESAVIATPRPPAFMMMNAERFGGWCR